MDHQSLCTLASQAAKNAYAPYSNFPVGAALLTTDGKAFTGCNVENVSFGLTICAERVAITKAVSEGYRSFQSIAISISNAHSPCGACRQFLSEFGSDITVLQADQNGVLKFTTIVNELLPSSFKKL